MNFDCLNINDIIKLIFLYEMISFLFVQTSGFAINMLQMSPAYRKFIKRYMP
jgi:hypothetical protein